MGNAQDTTDDGESFVDELAPGTELLQGQFIIEKFLNSGGFGITYLAKDSLERRVVIKECFPSSFCHRSRAIVQPRSGAHAKELKSVVDLFVQEARSLAKMDHPNIVGVHQVFEDNQTAYMVLDFVEGRDLLDTLEDENHGLTPVQIKGILTDVLGAVDYIHKQDILHRDISPDNILIDGDLRPVLIDFGAAREEATKKSRVLSALRVVKDGYSPQEFYIQGSEQTPSSDLYALGATFYHLIEGDIPPNSQARLASIASGEADTYQPLAGRIKGYDQKFLGAIDTALGILPKDRLQSAQEWLDAMEGKRRNKSRAMTTPIPMSSAAAATVAAENKSPKLVMLLGSAAAIAIIAVGGMIATGTIDMSGDSTDVAQPAVVEETNLVADAEAEAARAEAEAEAEAARIAEAEAAEAVAALMAEAEAAEAEAARVAEAAEAEAEEAVRLAEVEAAEAQAEAARLAEADAAEAEAAQIAEDEVARVTQIEAAEQEVARIAEENATEAEAEAARIAAAEAEEEAERLAEVAAAEAKAEQDRIAAAAEAEAERIAELAEKKAEEERLAAIAEAEAEAIRLAEIAAAEARAEEDRLAAIAAAEAAEAARIAALSRVRPTTRDDGASAAFFSSDVAPFAQAVVPTPAALTNTRRDLSALSATKLDDASLNRFVTVLPDVATQELVASIDLSVPASAAAVTAAVDITTSNGILSAWSVELPFSGENGSNVISETAVVAPAWARKGVEIVAVNGRSVDSMADITTVLRATTEPVDGPLQPVSFAIKSPDSDRTVEQPWQLPILQETVLLNGVGFTTRFVGDNWKTVVTSVPDNQSELEVGDELVAFMGTSEQLTERTSLTDIIRRELDNGVDQFSFAVSRSGSMWVASMTYAGGA